MWLGGGGLRNSGHELSLGLVVFFSGRIASREQKLTLGPRLGGMKGKIQRILLGGKSVPLRVV